MQYKELPPKSQQGSYSSSDGGIDFLLKIGLGQELVANSMTLHGVLKFTKTDGSTVLAHNDAIMYDHRCGAHAMISSWTTDITNRGIVENLSDYDRFYKMHEICNKDSVDLGCDTSDNKQLKCSHDEQSTLVLIGNGQDNWTPFSIKPRIALNRTSKNLPYSRVGDIDISLRLHDAVRCSFGADRDANNVKVELQNLYLSYRIQPQTVKPADKILMTIMDRTRNTIESNTAHLELELPIASRYVSTTFTESSKLKDNNLTIQKPALTRLKYKYNDSNNKLVSFDLINDEEILMQYIRSLSDSKDIERSDIKSNNLDSTYGVGMSLGDAMLPAKTKVTLELHTDADNTKPYTVFSYYNGLVEV